MPPIIIAILIFVVTYSSLNYAVFSKRKHVVLTPVAAIQLEKYDENAVVVREEPERKESIARTIDDLESDTEPDAVEVAEEEKIDVTPIESPRAPTTFKSKVQDFAKKFYAPKRIATPPPKIKPEPRNVAKSEPTKYIQKPTPKKVVVKKEINRWGREPAWQSKGLGELYINKHGYHESGNERG